MLPVVLYVEIDLNVNRKILKITLCKTSVQADQAALSWQME